jgi:hypothetical protein
MQLVDLTQHVFPESSIIDWPSILVENASETPSTCRISDETYRDDMCGGCLWDEHCRPVEVGIFMFVSSSQIEPDLSKMAPTTQKQPTAEATTTSTRNSTETDRRHLLTSSVAPSETSSIYTIVGTTGSITPRASSPQRHTRHLSIASFSTTSTQVEHSYRGFPSRAEYMAALSSWADTKLYLEPSEPGAKALKGFFGETTLQELAARPAPVVEGLGLRRKWRARKQSRVEERERKNVMLKEEEERLRLERRATVV